ncbi:hypothetical protein [Glutamicibacter arilaitensis]|uniref:hypothetical protein n=1 Tax=Glutamicibacter arilaitensis TaxID=256701 RepID=UPI003FD005A0
MAAPKRRTLADRNNDAISREDKSAIKEAAEIAPVVQEPAMLPTSEAETKAPKRAKTVGRPARTIDVTRVGIYLTPEQFNNAKAAYLADWKNGGEANTFTLWIGEAITRHAARSLKSRLRFAANKPARAEVRTGSSRSFNVPTSAIELMRAAISQEQAEERWLSDSSWCAEAVDAAISTARERNGEELPTPPSRLPNRLVR